MRLMRRRLKRLREEDGYTMVAVVAAIALITLLTAAAVAATNGDQRLIMRDLDQKRAYQAAQAGIADYTYHLNNDSGYWTRCTGVPTPNAVNQQGSTTNRRTVPGATDGSQYAIELVPATGHSFCDASNPDPVDARVDGARTSAPSGSARRVSAGPRNSRSSPRSSRRPSSTMSTSRSSRPRTRSPTASRIRPPP